MHAMATASSRVSLSMVQGILAVKEGLVLMTSLWSGIDNSWEH